MKKNVKLSLTDRNVESLLTLGENVVGGMTGNASFPAPPVTMAVLTAAVDALRAAHNSAVDTRSRMAYAQVREERLVVEDMLRKLGDYVDMIANGVATIIISAGMEATRNREKSPTPSQVNDFIAKFTGIPGTIVIQWRRPQYAKYFRVYMSSDPNKNDWQLVDTISVRKMMVQNLTTGQKFYFKVVPVGTAGVGPDSEIAEAIAA